MKPLNNQLKALFAKFLILTMIFFTGLSKTENLYAEQKGEVLAVATFVVGKAYYIRGGKQNKIKVKTIFEKDDVIKTEKGSINIQIGPSAILKVSNYSEVTLGKLFEVGGEQEIALALKQGRIYSKIVKKLGNKSKFSIRTPTVVAGVRGTEFLVSESPDETRRDDEDRDVPSGVFVNEGAVEAESSESGESMNVNAGQQVETKSGAFQQKILDDFIKRKMEIFKKLDVMKEKNYELLKKQKEKNKALMDKIRGR
ncbi:MAG: FecR family protein [Spirochaetia bacterium]|nr:FecR family protein [Spirochaetia bacterium]